MENPPEPPVKVAATRPVRSDFAPAISYGMRRIITVCVLMVAISSGIYFTLGHSVSHAPAGIPTIKAEGPSKQRPDQPGGIDIPHRDVEVYRALDNSLMNNPPIEHLLPPPETPQQPPPAPQKAAAPPVPQVPVMESLLSQPPKIETTVTQAPMQPPVVVSPAPKSARPLVIDVTPPSMLPASPPSALPPAATTPVPVTNAPIVAAVSAPPVKASPPKVSVPVVDTTKPPTAKQDVNPPVKNVPPKMAADKNGPVVQLASTQDRANAQQIMNELQNKYASILGDAKLRLVKANLGAKGIYYRIQSEPVAKEQANDICRAVKKLNAGCIIVRH